MFVACLCAQWCRTCEGFRAVFEAYADSVPEHALRWIDVEDEAELIGDLDIETFPTLLVLDATRPVYFGPILPTREHLAQTVARPGGMTVTDGDAVELAARLVPRG